VHEYFGLPYSERILHQQGKTEEKFHELQKGILIAEDESLCSFHYIKLSSAEEKRTVEFEMYLSDEARILMKKLGFKKIRKLFGREFEVITVDPFGNQSIDPAKNEDFAKKMRTVNTISQELENILGRPVAIKGTGMGLQPGHPDREDLILQYRKMKELEIVSKGELSSEEKELLEFLPVFGVIRCPVSSADRDSVREYQEWLIMERVVGGGSRIEDESLAVIGRPYACLGFKVKDHPELAKVFGRVFSGDDYCRWEDVEDELRMKGIPVGDLAGRNVLWHLNPEGKKSLCCY